MAAVDLEYNKGFQIYNANGTKFHDLVLHKCTYETVVMSLGDKISGILYYKDNALGVKMTEYIIYKGVKYTLVNPPTILKEGLVSDNGELKGMTKYSFTFYHPMYVLNNFSFNDVAVSSDQNKYLSQNKTFSWIGNLNDYVAKINKNLQGTEWIVKVGDNVTQEEKTKLSDVLSFDKNTIAEALKRGYETWEVPYVVDSIQKGEYFYINDKNQKIDYYDEDKHFVVQYGLPTTEITVKDDNDFETPYVFKMGQGVGLKNNSRNPKNNKIITRIAGYGSEDNIPYGYPQIRYYGGTVQYPLYYGIVGGQRVQLIKHPFTRNHLMPSVYGQAVYNKVNPKLSDGSNNPNYNPDIELVDYYDADSTYANPIKSSSPSYEIHEFGDIKPELGEETIINAVPVNAQETQEDYKQKSDFLQEILNRISSTDIDDEKVCLKTLYDKVDAGLSYYAQKGEEGGREYWYRISVTSDEYYQYVSYESGNYNFTATVLKNDSSAPTPEWDDTMDDDGNYLQSYFKITLPILSFDLYACAAITQEMKINMRSGACIGCTFPVQVDWDDYKRNFYNSDGEFDPDGEQRDYTKYPDSSSGQITVMVKKELETFGTLMPNQYQQPTTGDKFVILGISLPESYITNAEQRLDADMKQYMRDNNVYYYEYPLKFDEHFLISNENILSQMKPNVVVRFEYAGKTHALYIKQMSVKYNESPLPKYDITLTDDIEIVLNQIGQVTDEVSKLRLGLGENGIGGNGQEYIRKDIDDTARGTIRMVKGMQVGERFVTGLLGEGGVFRKDVDGTTYLETDKLYVRMKAYFDTVEVKHYLHTGGNRIASQASGIVCSRVEYINNNDDVTTDLGEAVLFRCYFKANDGDKTIRNDFMIGDLAFCRETNVDVSEVNMHGYWRLVIGRNGNGSLTENKEGWIDLSNRVSETLTIDGKDYVCNGYQNGSDAPIAQDDIIQLGNIANTDRQGAIVEYVGGEDAPSYQIFQGIGEDLPYPYTLEDKNYVGFGYSSQTGHAYMNVYGDVFIGAKPDAVTGESPTYIKYDSVDKKLTIKAVIDGSSPIGDTDTTIEQAFADLLDDITDLQSQIDGSIETFFNDYMPVAKTQEGAPANRVPLVTITIDGHTVPCEPYNSWYTADHGGTAGEVNTERLKHLGDIFYDNTSGYAFRFSQNESTHVFEWVEITDSAVIKALRDAAEAYGLADTKNKIFTTVAGQLPPYPWKEGDLWVNATYPADGSIYSNDILKCKQDRTSDGSINDWTLASKYTDDKKVERYTNILTGLVEPSETSDKELALAAENAIRTALGGNFLLEGGLMLMSIIGMRRLNDGGDPSDPDDYTTWAGISGVYDDNLYGGGIAAWYGGGMIDKRNPTTGEYDVANGAKSGFRFDGSGWLANGNINWNAQGAMVIKNIETIYGTGSDSITINELSALTSIFHTETYGSGGVTELLVKPQNAYSQLFINRSGNPLPASSYPQDHTINEYSVLNYGEMKSRFVPLDFFNALFSAFSVSNPTSSSTPIDPSTWTASTVINNLKIKVGTWTEQYLSALGINPNGSSGGGTGDVTWDLLASNSDTRQIALSHLTTALSGYATQSWVQSQGYTTNIGTVTQVKVGTTAYNPSSGVVSLPAYPTTLPASDVSAWAKASTKPSYTLDEVSDGSTRKLSDYTKTTAFKSLSIQGNGTSVGTYSPTSALTVNIAAGSNISITNDTTNHKITIANTYSYTLPNATTSAKGGVIIGNGLSVSDGKVSLGTSGVTAGTYRSVTVDKYGRVTNGTNPTTLAGYGITDAKIASGVITLGSNNITPVTSVGLSAPTGFSVTNTPVTKTGTLTLSYASGYEGFTTTLKNKIDLLYSLFTREGSGTSSDPYVIKANYGLYSESFISALGNGSGSSGGGGVGDVTWDLLASNSDTRPIALSHLTGALSGYATQSWVNGQGFLKSGSLSDYVTLNTEQTITGAKTFSGTIAPNGGIIPRATGGVNTHLSTDNGKLVIKEASGTVDKTPNNGLVIEWGINSKWVGQLYFGDNGTQGLYWGGWRYINNVLTRDAWRKFAFTDEIVSNIGEKSITNAMLANNSVTINGTSVNLGGSVTTTKWGTARTITIADNSNTNTQTNTNIDGSANFTLKLPATIKAALTGNADTATKLATPRTLTIGSKGYTFDGSKDVTWTLDEMNAANRTLSNLASIIDHTTNNAEYYPVWYNGTSELFTSKADLKYNPANKRLTVGSALAVGNSYLTGSQLRIGASTSAYHITMGNEANYTWFDMRDASDTTVNAFQLYPEYTNFSKSIKALYYRTSHDANSNDGSIGWLKVAEISVVSAYANQPLKFRITQRGMSGGDITLRFSNTNPTDTNVSEFSYTGNITAAKIVKDGTTFSMYIQKSERFDEIGITLVDSAAWSEKRLSVTWKDEFLSNDPGGLAATCRYYLSNNVYFTYDSANGGVHLVGGGLYADTYISALGKGDDGGTGTFDESQMWTALGTNITTKKIKQSYLDLTGYVQTSALSAYMKGVKVNGTSYTTKDANGIVDLGEIKADLSNYLKLDGTNSMTGGLNFKFGHDLTQANNGVTTTKWYGIRIYDKNEYLSAQLLNQVQTDGTNALNFNLRNRNGSTEYNKSLMICLTKSGVISASLGGAFTANSFIKSGGTSSQFLKADGSVDSNMYIVINTAGGIGTLEGQGQNNYFKIATITITTAYCNRPIVFELSQRGYEFSIVQVLFKSVNTTDPELLSFTTNNANPYYIKKAATSTWEVYGKYNETWGLCTLHRITGCGANIGVVVSMENVGIEAPENLIQCSYSGNVETAARLRTTRKLWGRDFNGTGNVSGDMTGVGSITASGNIQASKFIGDLQGNADTATTASKLSTISKKAWGQTYWTSGGVPTTISGDMTGVGSITMSGAISGATTISASSNVTVGGTLGVTGETTLSSTLSVSGDATLGGGLDFSNGGSMSGLVSIELNSHGDLSGYGGFIDFHYNGSSADYTSRIIEDDSGRLAINSLLYVLKDGNVGIGTSSPSAKLDVQGSVKIGGATLTWDSDNQALKIDKGFYSDSFVSALGANASGGSGSGIDADWLKTNDVQIKRLGIGVAPTSPYSLYVNGSSSYNGNININGNIIPTQSATTSIGNSSYPFYGGYFKKLSASENLTVGDSSVSTSYNLYVKGSSYFNGNVGIGTTSTAFKLDVLGVARATELRLRHGLYIDWNSTNDNAYTIGHDQEDIYADGDWYGRWVSSSDVRLKDINQYLDGKLEDIALAPIFSFRWKNKPNKPLELGTSAQYWKEHLPYGVTQAHSGYLALDYGATALAAAVFTARKVVDHELRVKQLEERIAELENEIKELKAA